MTAEVVDPALDMLPERTPLAAVADEAFDRIAHLVRRVLGVPVGLVSLVDRDGQVFPGQAGLPDPYAETRRTPLTHSFCQHVVQSGEPLVVPDARIDPRLVGNLAIADLGVVGYAGIPLVERDGSIVGSLCAIDTKPHDWSYDEIVLLADLAATCSAELQLRSAATAAADAQARTAVLLELSETLSQTLTAAEISRAVSTTAVERLGAAFGGIMLLDADRQTLAYADPVTLPEPLREQFGRVELSRPSPSTRTAVDSASLFVADVQTLRRRYPQSVAALDAIKLRSAAYVPLRVGDATVGALTIFWSDQQDFGDEDRALLNGLSHYAAQAVERARLHADYREVAETLQAAMLPTLPEIAWVDLAGRYLPARVADAVGGDWYDAFSMSGTELAISVGDVEGHDTQAAAAMGQLRSMLRSLTVALNGRSSDVLSALDGVFATLPPARYATGILGTLTHGPESVSLTWSNAGHQPPVLVPVSGSSTLLHQRPALPLGMRIRPAERPLDSTILPPGSTLLLFTDGLVERSGLTIDDAVLALQHSAERHRGLALRLMLDAVLADLIDDKHQDDIVLFGLRLR